MSAKAPEVRPATKGTLGACLVDGDTEQVTRARRSRSKALVLSLVIQAAALAALVLFPLLATGEKLSFVNVTPVPPFYGVPQATERRITHAGGPGHASNGPTYDSSKPLTHIPTGIVIQDRRPASNSENDAPDIGSGPVIGKPWGVEILDTRRPVPPVPSEPVEKHPRVIQVSHMDPAALIHRVEPAYPVLAKLAHREGRVELRAIIATDGSINSLEVLSGDPLFIQASCDAVLQWRYRPLFLGGQPVEIETRITVIFTLQH